MNIINWMGLKLALPFIWSYSTSKVGMAMSFFEAPSLKEAQDQISYSLLSNLGPEIGVLKWRKDDDEENTQDVWILSASISFSDSDDIGYLNDRINTVDAAVLINIELTEEEKIRKQRRLDRLRKEMERPSGDPEDSSPWGRQPSPNPYGWDPYEKKYPPRDWRNEYKMGDEE